MYFLDRDIGEMSRLTGGTATYFRNRIRHAFVDKAEVKPVEVERDGRKESATEIVLTPFRNEAHLAGSPGLQAKRYRFLLSDKVPGTIYEIGAEVPAEAGQAPLLTETMTFAGERPCPTEAGPCVPPKQP
jgi:hypothetical protein